MPSRSNKPSLCIIGPVVSREMNNDDDAVQGFCGAVRSMRWANFCVVAVLSTLVLLFSMGMAAGCLFSEHGPRDQLIVWTNLVTFILAAWLPSPSASKPKQGTE